MNKNAKKWVAALRSGKYKQGRGNLCTIKKGVSRFCCLGVACDLYSKQNRIKVKQSGDIVNYAGHSGVLPHRVRRWLGLRNGAGAFVEGLGYEDLAALNDEGKRFVTIARIIESEPEGLFEKA